MSGPIASKEKEAIIRCIKAAGPEGATVAQVVQATGDAINPVRMHLKNLSRAGVIVRLIEGNTRCQLYAIAEKRKPNLPPRSDSVTIITKAQPRNHNLSEGRAMLEKALLEATEAKTPKQLSSELGIDIVVLRRYLQAMRHLGFCANVGQGRDVRYRATVHSRAEAAVASAKSLNRVCNGNRPAAPANYLPTMGCMRPGADDYQRIPSRVGDKLVPYQAPVFMTGAT